MNENLQIKQKRSKKGALIFIMVLVVLLAISIPLLFIDLDPLAGIPKREVRYYPPEYDISAWEEPAYIELFPLYISVCEDGFANYQTKPFSNPQEAKESFAEVEKYQHGASAVADYFYAALCGCDSEAEQTAFRLLFTEDYEDDIPTMFPEQKVYNIQMFYEGESGDDRTEIWKVYFDVLRNDGTVFNYTGARDGGSAHFYLTLCADGKYRISDIIGIVKVN